MRTKHFATIAAFFFLSLVGGVFYTQVLCHGFYKGLSEKNRIRALPLEAPRGKIYDRNGSLLVTSRLSFDVAIIFQELKDREKVAALLSRILGIEKDILEKRIESAKNRPFVAEKVAEDIAKEKAICIEEINADLPGVIITTRPLRDYLYGTELSHVTGYLGKISPDELRKYKIYGYRMRDFIGKDGIERSYNDYLKGTDGGLQVEVDAKGREKRVLAVKEPRPGSDISLSIDIRLQKFCDSLFAEKRGVVIVMDAATGAVLALLSHPDFNANAFVKPNNFRQISRLLSDSNAFPMMDRAIGGRYPLGSVFKIVVATAALESGNFDENKTLFCNGSFSVGNRIFRCWKEKGHGHQQIKDAMKHSCNVFFYQLGLIIGVNEISKYAFRFGLGRPTGIDLPGEASGFVPTPSWKRRNRKEPWFKGETANYSIGQGYLLVTPIQVVRLVSAIANGGKLVQPFLVEKIEDISLRHPEPESMRLDRSTIETVKTALKMAINFAHGTGFYARSKNVVISGKTGTAQNPLGKSHAWFVGFAPFEKPRISVVVFIEHGGKGGLDPARFAKKIIEEAKRLELL